MKKDRILRLLVPSVPVLARTPLAPILDMVDGYIRRGHEEWRELPPASLRMKIGVGNRIIRNHEQFIESGKMIVTELSGRGFLAKNSSVLELGCGCGRNAIALSRFLGGAGSYAGQDVDREMIEWCQNNLQNERIKFYHADLYSKVYNPDGKPVEEYTFPAGDGSVSLIISVSLYSHLLSKDFAHYIKESGRVLFTGGHLHMTLFLLDFVRPRLGDRWTFSHKLDDCYVDSLRYPEAAVAYELKTVEKFLGESSLSIVDIYNKDNHQQTVIARKRA